MKDNVLQVTLLQISILMFTSALFIAFWTYFYIAYEAISIIQLSGYYVIWVICGANFFVLGPIGISILSAEIKRKCITRTTLSCYILLCFLSFAPTPLLLNVFSKAEDTRLYLHDFFLKYGRVPFLMQYIQRAHHCCGYNNYTDYYANSSALEDDDVALNEPVPPSCCAEIKPGCQMSIGMTYKAGCFVSPGTSEELTAWDHPYHGTGFLPVVLIPIVLPFLHFLQACFLCQAFGKLEKINTKGVNVQMKNDEDEEDAVPVLVQKPSDGSNRSGSGSSSSSKSSSGTGSLTWNPSLEPKPVSRESIVVNKPVKSPIGLKTLFLKNTKRSKRSSTTNSKNKESESKYSKESSYTTEYSSQSSLPSEMRLTQEEAFKLVSNYFERLPNPDGLFDHEMITPVHVVKKRESDDEPSYNNNSAYTKGRRIKSDEDRKSRNKDKSNVVNKVVKNGDSFKFKYEDAKSHKSDKFKDSAKSRSRESGKSRDSKRTHESENSGDRGELHHSKNSGDSGESHHSKSSRNSEKTQEIRRSLENDEFPNSSRDWESNKSPDRVSIVTRDRRQSEERRVSIKSEKVDNDSMKSSERRQSQNSKDSHKSKKSGESGNDSTSTKNRKVNIVQEDRFTKPRGKSEPLDLIQLTRQLPKSQNQSDLCEVPYTRHNAHDKDDDVDEVTVRSQPRSITRSRDSDNEKQRLVVYAVDERKSKQSQRSQESGKRSNEIRGPEKSKVKSLKEEILSERRKSSRTKSKNTENLIMELLQPQSGPKDTENTSGSSKPIKEKSQTSKSKDKQSRQPTANSRSVVPATRDNVTEDKHYQPHLALVPYNNNNNNRLPEHLYPYERSVGPFQPPPVYPYGGPYDAYRPHFPEYVHHDNYPNHNHYEHHLGHHEHEHEHHHGHQEHEHHHEHSGHHEHHHEHSGHREHEHHHEHLGHHELHHHLGHHEHDHHHHDHYEHDHHHHPHDHPRHDHYEHDHHHHAGHPEHDHHHHDHEHDHHHHEHHHHEHPDHDFHHHIVHHEHDHHHHEAHHEHHHH